MTHCPTPGNLWPRESYYVLHQARFGPRESYFVLHQDSYGLARATLSYTRPAIAQGKLMYYAGPVLTQGVLLCPSLCQLWIQGEIKVCSKPGQSRLTERYYVLHQATCGPRESYHVLHHASFIPRERYFDLHQASCESRESYQSMSYTWQTSYKSRHYLYIFCI